MLAPLSASCRTCSRSAAAESSKSCVPQRLTHEPQPTPQEGDMAGFKLNRNAVKKLEKDIQKQLHKELGL